MDSAGQKSGNDESVLLPFTIHDYEPFVYFNLTSGCISRKFTAAAFSPSVKT
jgi:hypothetical protein